MSGHTAAQGRLQFVGSGPERPQVHGFAQEAVALLEQVDGPLGLLAQMPIEVFHLLDEVRTLDESLFQLGLERFDGLAFAPVGFLQAVTGRFGFREARLEAFRFAVAALQFIQVQGHGIHLSLNLLSLGLGHHNALIRRR